MHPTAAARLGVREGDWVVVEAVRPLHPGAAVHVPGYRVRGRVHVTHLVRPDVVFVPHGTGQLSPAMASYAFGPPGGDGAVKPVMLDYSDPSASSMDQDVVVRVRRG